MDEARRLEPAVMVTERNWNAMLKIQHDLFRQQMQLDADLKKLLTKQEEQEALTEMQMSAAEFARQAGSLNERYSSACKELTNSARWAMTTILDDAPTRDRTTIALHIDSKRRRKLRQKKTALGHAEDDHEEWTMEQHL